MYFPELKAKESAEHPDVVVVVDDLVDVADLVVDAVVLDVTVEVALLVVNVLSVEVWGAAVTVEIWTVVLYKAMDVVTTLVDMIGVVVDVDIVPGGDVPAMVLVTTVLVTKVSVAVFVAVVVVDVLTVRDVVRAAVEVLTVLVDVDLLVVAP
ncbi:hypothetical protein HDU93_001656 [Gonapodya sp. JEL0774]|nr:hypothetical protein HDU93_001656 [Gonapodya sp. JEL0774]